MCTDFGLLGYAHAHRLAQAQQRPSTDEVKFPDFGPAPIEGECHEVLEPKRIARDSDPSLPAS